MQLLMGIPLFCPKMPVLIITRFPGIKWAVSSRRNSLTILMRIVRYLWRSREAAMQRVKDTFAGY